MSVRAPGYYLDIGIFPNVSVEADWMLNQSSYSCFSMPGCNPVLIWAT